MDRLSNEFLIEAYTNAIKLKMSSDFIALLEAEIKKRGLEDQLAN